MGQRDQAGVDSEVPTRERGDLRQAREYAYGGSVIQDLGYYPFGSHFCSNLLHYIRSGDFVEMMIREARDERADHRASRKERRQLDALRGGGS